MVGITPSGPPKNIKIEPNDMEVDEEDGDTQMCSICNIEKGCDDFYPSVWSSTKARRCRICISTLRDSYEGQIAVLVNRAYAKTRRWNNDPQKYIMKQTIDISRDWFRMQYEKQSGRCYYSGVIMTSESGSPFQMSIERIRDDIGYISDNCVIICCMFNVGSGRSMSKSKFSLLRSKVYMPLSDDECARIIGSKPFKDKFSKNTLKRRCKTRGRSRPNEVHECTIEECDIAQIYMDQSGLCAYSDMLMSLDTNSDWIMSLERKDPTLGYTVSNCCLVCIEFNTQIQVNRNIIQNVISLSDRNSRTCDALENVGQFVSTTARNIEIIRGLSEMLDRELRR